MTGPSTFTLRVGVLALLLLAAAASVGIINWKSRSTNSSVDVPSVDLSNSPAAAASLIRQSRESVLESPTNAALWGRLGMSLFAHQWENEAAACFQEAAVLDATDARWPYLEALCVMSADRERAIELLRRAIAIQPDVGAAHSRLGELLLESGELEAADDALQTAIRLQPESLRPLAALARVAQRQTDYDRALNLANEAARLAPDRRAVLELMASIQHGTGDHAGAAASLQMAEGLPDVPLEWDDPVAAEVISMRRDTEWRLGQARQMLATQQHSQGIEILKDILATDRSDPRIFCTLGRAHLEVGDTDAALSVLEDAETEFPESAEVQFTLGVAHFFLEDLPAARAAFEQAVQLKPDYALAWFNLGQTLERMDFADKALAAYQSAVNAHPSLISGQLAAARLLLAAGESEPARQHLEAALQFSPDNTEAKAMLAEHFAEAD